MRVISLIIWLTVCATVCAEPAPDSKPPEAPAAKPPLTGVLVGRLPEYARWQVVGGSNDSERPSATPDKPHNGRGRKPPPSLPAAKTEPAQGTVVEFTRSGNLLHVEAKDPRGNTLSHEWHQGTVQVTTRPEWREPLLSNSGNRSDAAYISYAQTDFPTLRWISKKNYVGVEMKDDHVCLVFRDRLAITPEGKEISVDPAPASGQEADSVPVTAYIDYYGRLPVRSSRGAETFSYRYLPPPAQAQTLPDEIQTLIKARQDQQQTQTLTPAKP